MYAFGLCSLLGSLLLISSGQSLTLLLCFPLLTRSCYFVASYLLRALSTAWVDSYRLLHLSYCVFVPFISLVTSANASIHESGVCRNLFLLHSLVGRPFGRILRAEPSSNGSSDPPSDSPSELSSHQIPRRLRVPLQLKGCTRTSYFEFTHYAFGGVCAMSALCTLALHFGFGAEQACSAAARVTSSPVHLGQPLLPALAVWVSSCTRRLLTPRCAACGSTLQWVCFPFKGFYVILPVLVYARDIRVPGRTDVFSRPRQRGSSCIALRMSSLLTRLFRGVVWHPGDRTCFPGRD